MKNSETERTPYLDNLVKEYLSSLESFYPGIRYVGRSSTYSGEQPYNCRLNLSLRNSNVKETSYEASDQKYVIHYTSSLQNLFSILNSGFLRLSNLASLSDPQELRYMAKEVNWLEPSQLDFFRKAFHSASFCGVGDLSQPDNFPMWRLYGGDGYGTAIVFEILNPTSDWHKYMLAKVQYGSSFERVKYIEFMRFHSKFQMDNNRPIRDWPEAIVAFMSMHKNEIWDYEEEIRLISYYAYDDYTLKSLPAQNQASKLKHALAHNGKPYSYLELPLYGSSKYFNLEKFYNEDGFNESFFQSMPILKIKKIVLGYHHSIDTVLNCEDVVSHISKTYGHHIEIGTSYIKKYMI